MKETLLQNTALTQQLFNFMVEQFSDRAFFTINLQHEISSWNNGAKQVFGYTAAEVIGKKITFLFAAIDAEKINQYLKTDSFTETSAFCTPKNADIFTATIKSFYLNGDGIEGFALSIQINDDSINQLPSNSFLNSDFFKKLLSHSPSGIALLNIQFNFIYHSETAVNIAGLSLNSIQKSILSIVDETATEEVSAVLQEVLASPDTPKSISFKLKGSQNSQVLKGVLTNMLHDKHIAAIVFNFWDVTDQNKSDLIHHQTISELSAYKYALDESAIVAITDQKGKIKHVNQNFCAISKYSASALIGQDHRMINSCYHDKEFFKNLWTTIANGKIWKGEIKNKAKDGTFYWVDTTIIPFIGANGNPYQYVAIRSNITERKNNEAKIKENEIFIKTLTDNLPAMVAYWDKDLNCQFMNKLYLNLLGKKNTNEVIGKQKCEIVKANQIGYHEKEIHLENAFAGKKQTFKGIWRKQNGTLIYTENHYLPDIKDGEVKGVYSFIYDVSENTKINGKLKGTIKQIGDLLESITDGFIALDKNFRYTYANKRVANMLGLAVKDMLGKHIWDLFPDAVGSATYLAINEALTTKAYVSNEDYFEPLDLWQENRIYPWGDGLSIFITDISDRKRKEREIKILSERFSLITKATKDALFDWDLLKNKVWWSESHYSMFGYNVGDPIPNREEWLKKILPDSRPVLDKIIASAMSGEIDEWEVEITYYKNDGYGTLLNRAFIVRDEEQKAVKILGSFIDITDRKNDEMEKALLSDISIIFNKQQSLTKALEDVLALLIQVGNFCIAEAWLISTDQTKINLMVKKAQNQEMDTFFELQTDINHLDKGVGLPGIVWDLKEVQFWNDITENEFSLKREAGKKIGMKSAFGLPLLHNNEVVGVFVLGQTTNKKPVQIFTQLLNSLSTYIGSEISRKLLEEELRQVFNNAPDIICIIGADRRFKKANPAMCNLLEYTEQELLSAPIDKFLHPDEVAISQKRMAGFVKSGEILSFENRYVSKSGKVKSLAWTTTKSADNGFFFSVAKDITEKRELEELLQKASNLAKIGSWELDLQNRSIFCSDLVREVLEVDADFSLHIFNWEQFLGASAYAILNEKFDNAIKSGIPFDIEIEIISAKKKRKWIRIIGDAVFENGNCEKVYGSFQDIDIRKKAEETAKSLFRERNTILERIDDGFFATDKNWIVTYWNSAAERMIDVPKEQILNKNLWEVFPPDESSFYYDHYTTAMKDNKANRVETYDESLKKWLEVSMYPSIDGLSVYFKDINDRKDSEIKLNALNNDLTRQTKELATSNAELEQFAYVASHDLQEPLRMVTSFLTQLEKKYTGVIDDRGKRYIHFAVDGAKRMRQIILDLLEFSRIGRTADNLEEINLNILIEEILGLYRREIGVKNAKVTVAQMPTIFTYTAPLRQVFQNIIGNALKYTATETAPVITIKCKEKQALWEFAISDNGIGIDEEYFEKIFIIFQRLHTNDEYLGTGMGLALSKKIINNLGGKIWLESTEGKGSTFYFTIPK